MVGLSQDCVSYPARLEIRPTTKTRFKVIFAFIVPAPALRITLHKGITTFSPGNLVLLLTYLFKNA